jgi:cytochrome c oxidase subunit II
MKVHVYERAWMWLGMLMIVGFLATVVVSAVTHAVHPPSHVEMVDPGTVRSEGEFAHPGVVTSPDGAVTATILADLYTFQPGTIRVPAGSPVTFRLTSADVVHGFQIVGTNGNAMVIPGYVTQFTLTFPNPGEFLIVCNEYCGLSHHRMAGKLVVEPREKNS